MRVLVDAQISPATARWMESEMGVPASHVFDEQLLQAADVEIFERARSLAFDAILTKDRDFVNLVERRGRPPAIIWLTFGNCTNPRLHWMLARMLPKALDALAAGEDVVEISDAVPR